MLLVCFRCEAPEHFFNLKIDPPPKVSPPDSPRGRSGFPPGWVGTSVWKKTSTQVPFLLFPVVCLPSLPSRNFVLSAFLFVLGFSPVLFLILFESSHPCFFQQQKRFADKNIWGKLEKWKKLRVSPTLSARGEQGLSKFANLKISPSRNRQAWFYESRETKKQLSYFLQFPKKVRKSYFEALCFTWFTKDRILGFFICLFLFLLSIFSRAVVYLSQFPCGSQAEAPFGTLWLSLNPAHHYLVCPIPH